MGSLKGVDIQRGSIGANVLGNSDTICGLLLNGVAVAPDSAKGIIGIAVNQTVKLTSLKELEAYGITEKYDDNNKLSVYRHVSEFYRMAGEGSTLHLRLYSGAMDSVFDTTAKQMIADAEGEIRVLAVGYTPAQNYTPAYTKGLEKPVYDSIKAAQEFYNWTYESFRPCQIILEGRGFNAISSADAANLRDLKDSDNQPVNAYKVSVCIGQDYAYAEKLSDDVRKKMADIGTMLGTVVRKAVNENIGEVAGGSLVDAVRNKWTVAGLSDHKKITQWDGYLEGLDSKGYIFAISYPGIAGYYWNNDHTCTPVVKDDEGYLNEYSISFGRVHDKAVRQLRTALLPKVKSSQPIDAATGKLPAALVGYFECLGDNVFNAMAAKGEISGGRTTVDADSDLLASPRILKVSFVVVPTGQIDEIKGTINLKTTI